MKALVLVARREIVERRMVLLSGLVFGLLPLLTPLLPGVTNAREARGATALMLLAALAWGAALVLGSTLWAKDLADGRLGFFFSRPVSPAALFGGKLLGAAALVAAASVLCVLPTALIDGLGGRILSGSGSGGILLLCVIVALLLLPVAHAASLAVRAHDAWIAADIASLAGCALLLAYAGRLFVHFGFWPMLGAGFVSALFLLPIVVLVGGFVHAARGRTDLRRSHRILSAVTWGTLLPVCLLALGFSWWFTHPSIGSFREVVGSAVAPRGGWTFVAGTMRHRGPIPFSFLVDAENASRSLPLGPAVFGGELAFSPDGTRAAWWALPDDGALLEEYGGRADVWTARLDADPPVATRTTISIGQRWQAAIALSPDGRRLVTVDRNVSVFDVASGKALAVARLPEGVPGFVPTFTDADHVHLVATWGSVSREPAERTISVFEFDVPGRRLVQTGSLPALRSTWVRVSVDASASRVVVLAARGPALLCDGRSGRLLATLVPAGPAVGASAFLTDGRIALGLKEGEELSLAHFSNDGAPGPAIPLGRGRGIAFGGQPAPQTLVVARIPVDRKGTEWGSTIVDLAAAKPLRELPGLFPASGNRWSPSTGTVSSGAPATLFLNGGRILRADPSTGAATQILP